MTGHQALLSLHLFFIALGIGGGFANFVGLYAGRGQAPEIVKGIAFQRGKLVRFLDVSLLMILITGGLLLLNLGGSSALNGWFQVKMTAVVIWVVGFVVLRVTVGQMIKSGNMGLMPRANVAAHVAWIAAVIALVCAVLTFAA